jgi:valyl-tRNA synthetase (EC 6.1.1.9)
VDRATSTLSDRWILSRYHHTAQTVNDYLSSYAFGEAAKELYEFIWGDFCDWYIELVKPCLSQPGSPSCATARWVLVTVLEGTLRLLHPFMPHITEEIWQLLMRGSSAVENTTQLLALQAYPQADPQYIDPQLEQQFTLLIGVIRLIRNLRATAEIKPSQKVTVYLHSENATELALLRSGQDYIQDLARVGTLAITTQPISTGSNLSGVVGTVQVILPLEGLVDLAQFQTKLSKDLAKLEATIHALQTRLNNPTYREKAKPEVISATEAELAEARKQQELLRQRWDSLQATTLRE